MSKLLFIVSILFTFDVSQAQTFKVVKIQGKKAIVEVSDPSQISVDQTYNVGSSMPTSGSGKSGSRKYGIALDFSMLSQSSPSYSEMKLSGKYIWNLQKYEIGPVVELSNVSPGTNTTEFGATGFYNFNPNNPGAPTVLSILGKLTIGSGSGSSTTNIYLGPNYRWFLLSSDHCFSFSALFKMSQSSGTTYSALKLEAGISTYF